MTTRKRSTFLGPQRTIQTGYPNWHIHMQLFDIEPGENWEPAWESELLLPRILLPHPTALHPFFNITSTHFVWLYQIGQIRNWIKIMLFVPGRPLVFIHTIHFAVQSFAYNEQVDPAGVYGINGSVTVSWKRAP